MDQHRGTYGEPSGEPQTPGHTSGAPESHDARDALHKWLNSGVDREEMGTVQVALVGV